MARKLLDGGKVSKASRRKDKLDRNGVFTQKAIRRREAVIANRASKQQQQQQQPTNKQQQTTPTAIEIAFNQW